MILANSRIKTVSRGLEARRMSGTMVSGRRMEEVSVQVSFALPPEQGEALIDLLRESGGGAAAPILIWTGSKGSVDIVVRDAALPGEPGAEGRTRIAVRGELKLPAPQERRPDFGDVVEAGGLVIHSGRHEVLHGSRAIPQLTFTEFGILRLLARKPGWVFSREQIVEGVRGPGYPVTDRAVNVQVAGLRKKMGAAAELVETVRGVGYRFRA